MIKFVLSKDVKQKLEDQVSGILTQDLETNILLLCIVANQMDIEDQVEEVRSQLLSTINQD